MTGLARCILVGNASHEAPFYYLALEAAIVVSNSLVQFIVAGACYAAWRHKMVARLLVPYTTLVTAAFVCLLLKYGVGWRHANGLPASCCAGYILTLDYSMPSLHAMAAVLLALYASEDFAAVLWPNRPSCAEEEEVEALVQKMPADPQTLRVCRIRLLAIWTYALAVVYSRVLLRLNGFWDVLLGVLLGGAAYACAHFALRWLEGQRMEVVKLE